MAKEVRKPTAGGKPQAASASKGAKLPAKHAVAKPSASKPTASKPATKVMPAKTATAKSAVKSAARTAPSKAQPKPQPKAKTPAKQSSKTTAQPSAKPAKPQTKISVQPNAKTQISAPKATTAKVASSITAPREARVTAPVPAPGPKANGSASIATTSKPSAGKVMSKKSGVDIAALKLPDGYRPNDDEPFMGPMQRAYFRHKLQKWKDDIIKETMETLQVLHDDTLQHPDLADRATHETDRALELRARDRQRKLISKIESAIRRVDDGTYGYCEETGEPISLKRLDARPIATLSLEAQERHERRERVYRDE